MEDFNNFYAYFPGGFHRPEIYDKDLGEDAPVFITMFDNVGGRWTTDLHMMTFLAYYNLDNIPEFWRLYKVFNDSSVESMSRFFRCDLTNYGFSGTR